MTLTPLKATYWRFHRIPYTEVTYDPDPEDFPEEDQPRQHENEDEDDYYERLERWKEDIRRVVHPEPGEFRPPNIPEHMKAKYCDEGTENLKPEMCVDLQRDYGHRGLQVIVKLANIELTPDKPEYEGGTWHVEGQLNEHICATALYYYDSENISSSRIAFRQQSSTDDTTDIGYAQDHHEWLSEVFGCEQYGPAVQEVGSVLCREGRLLSFPNTLQHRVQPFHLVDSTRKGHRKILALFLVDPGIRVISTANIPPQQKDWWSEEVLKNLGVDGLGKLSTELKEKIFDNVDDFPIGIDEAKQLRLKLMEERSKYVVQQKELFEANEFSLCEH